MKTNNSLSFSVTPKDCSALVALFRPRPIHNRVAHDNTVEVIDAMAGHALNKDQEDYLEVLVSVESLLAWFERPCRLERRSSPLRTS